MVSELGNQIYLTEVLYAGRYKKSLLLNAANRVTYLWRKILERSKFTGSENIFFCDHIRI